MPRKKAASRSNGASGENRTKRQTGKTNHISPQVIQDFLEHQRVQQMATTQGFHVGPDPSLSAGEGAGGRPIPNGNESRANNGATFALPHNLGQIIVPPGAQRVDVRFNCITNKLATGQLTDTLVVKVDVLYRPANIQTSKVQTNVKQEEGNDDAEAMSDSFSPGLGTGLSGVLPRGAHSSN